MDAKYNDIKTEVIIKSIYYWKQLLLYAFVIDDNTNHSHSILIYVVFEGRLSPICSLKIQNRDYSCQGWPLFIQRNEWTKIETALKEDWNRTSTSGY